VLGASIFPLDLNRVTASAAIESAAFSADGLFSILINMIKS
jgi:hypothetical protein